MKKIIIFVLVLFAVSLTGCTPRAADIGAKPMSSAQTSASAPADAGAKTVSAQVSSPPGSKAQISEPPDFADLDMLSADSGYAVTSGLKIVKTSDGGRSWTQISAMEGTDGAAAICTPDKKTLYAAAFTTAGITVERFADGGANFSATSIPLSTGDFDWGGSLSLSFVDPTHGYLLTSSFPAAGLMGRALYKTDDGRSWTKVADSSGAFSSFRGYTTGMAFGNLNTGFITCTYHGETAIPVYKTTDGGKSWSVLSLPLPQEYANSSDFYADVYPPCFLPGGGSKMELVFVQNGKHEVYFYDSTDGNTWRLGAASAVSPLDGPDGDKVITRFSFADSLRGFGLDATGELFVTEDGGAKWESLF